MPPVSSPANEIANRRSASWKKFMPDWAFRECQSRGKIGADFCVEYPEALSKWRLAPLREKQRQVGKRTKTWNAVRKTLKNFVDPECLQYDALNSPSVCSPSAANSSEYLRVWPECASQIAYSESLSSSGKWNSKKDHEVESSPWRFGSIHSAERGGTQDGNPSRGCTSPTP